MIIRIYPAMKEKLRPAKSPLLKRRLEKRKKRASRQSEYDARCAELTAAMVAQRTQTAAMRGGANFIRN